MIANARCRAENGIVSALLETREGRLFFAMMIEESGFLRNGFMDTPELTAFAQGERSIGGRIFNLILSCDESGTKPLECMNEYREWRRQVCLQELNKIRGYRESEAKQ